MAVMLGLGGAALCLALTGPAKVAAPDVEAYEIELLEVAQPHHARAVSCARGYSTALSAVEVFDRPEHVLTPRELVPDLVDLETAICFAEEQHLGEGQARMAHFEIDQRIHVPVWVVMGAEGQVVTIDARP